MIYLAATKRFACQAPPNALPPREVSTSDGRRRYFLYGVIFLSGILFGKGCFGGDSPASELHAALIDCRQLPPEVQHSTRYLSVYNVPEADVKKFTQITNFCVNQLSRTRAITTLDYVSHTLMRLTISYYAPDHNQYQDWYNAWESLAEFDPYWHIRTTVLIKGDKKHSDSTKDITTDGGWVNLAEANELRHLTGSTGPILRADYFCARSTDAPLYYQFAGIPPKEKDFLASVGVDQTVIQKLRADVGANLAISDVTKKVRRVVAENGPLGGVYGTLDVEKVDAARDPLRRAVDVGGPALQFDLGEWYVMAANGLWKQALYNAKGERQNTVPDVVAKDTSDPAGDGIVRNNQSCVRCHTEAGLKPFADTQTQLLSKSLLGSYDYRVIQRAKEFYDFPRLARQMQFDRETYGAACQKCSGLQPAELSAAFGDVIRSYLYAPVTPETAAADCGTDAKEFKAALVKTHDPIVLLLLDNQPVLRAQFESSFAECAVSVAARLPK